MSQIIWYNFLHVARQNVPITSIYTYYRPQTKFAKVMFLQVSVCPQGGHVWLLWGGMCGCSGGDVWWRGGCAWWKGGVCGEEGRAWCRGAFMVKGGMHGEGGHVWWRGAYLVKEGHAWWRGGAWYARSVIAWAVRILLECILVSHWVHK